MGETTAIAWTDHTFNPWWGCTNVSPGCDHCYAETFAKRTGHDVWSKDGQRRFFGDKHWAEPLRWNAKAEADGRSHRVFCASMADVFEPRPDLAAHRQRLWGLIDATPHLIWQLLTKRPEQVTSWVPPEWLDETGDWPTNVWIGTTVEDQQRAELRIPRLLAIPAPVRFLSCEPLLGPVDLGLPENHAGHERDYDGGYGYVCIDCSTDDTQARWTVPGDGPRIHWVICGGESGPRHRPLNVDHARNLRDQCTAAGVPFFFKQVGGRTPTAGGDQLDGHTYKEIPSMTTANRAR